MNFSRFSAATVAALVLGGAVPAVAGATDYCVTPNTGCGQHNVGDFQTALDQAAAGAESDRIFLGADTYVVPTGHTDFHYSAGNGPVEIVGAGRGRTVLTAEESSAATRVLYVAGAPGTSIHDLTVAIPQNVGQSFQGLATYNTARHIEITEDLTQTQPHYGAVIVGTGVLEDSSVKLNTAGSATGVLLGDAALDERPTLRRSTVYAGIGVDADGPSAVERSRVVAGKLGVVAAGDDVAITDSLLSLNGTAGTILRAETRAGWDTNVTADGDTLFAPNLPDNGGIAVSTSVAPTQPAHLTLTNSVVRAGPASFLAVGGAGGKATITASYSEYDPTGNVAMGNASIDEFHVYNVGNALFDEATGHAFELLPGSPLLDKGDPAAPQGLDLNGNPRVADGDGDGIPRRDLGAFELQPPPAGGPPPPPAGGLAADTQAPLITGFRAARSLLAVGHGTRFRYTISEKAHVVVKIQRRRAGSRSRYRTLGRLSRGATQGANRVRFSGRINRRALRPGRYRAIITASDGAGNRSARKAARFRVVRR